MWHLEGTSTSGASESPSHSLPGLPDSTPPPHHPTQVLPNRGPCPHRETLDDVLHRIVQLMQDDDCVSSWDNVGSSGNGPL